MEKFHWISLLDVFVKSLAVMADIVSNFPDELIHRNPRHFSTSPQANESEIPPISELD